MNVQKGSTEHARRVMDQKLMKMMSQHYGQTIRLVRPQGYERYSREEKRWLLINLI